MMGLQLPELSTVGSIAVERSGCFAAGAKPFRNGRADSDLLRSSNAYSCQELCIAADFDYATASQLLLERAAVCA